MKGGVLLLGNQRALAQEGGYLLTRYPVHRLIIQALVGNVAARASVTFPSPSLITVTTFSRLYRFFDMAWATSRQCAWLETRVQGFEDTIDDKKARTQWYIDLHNGWKERWPLRRKHLRMFPTYFRNKLVECGTYRKRVPVNSKSKRSGGKRSECGAPNANAYEARLMRSPLASATKLQHTRSLAGGAQETTSEGVCVCQAGGSDSAPGIVVPPRSFLCTLPSAISVSTSRGTMFVFDSTGEHPDELSACAPFEVWQGEFHGSWMFELDLQGVDRDEVVLKSQGSNLSVQARNSAVAYKWSTSLQGTIVADGFRSGMCWGRLRIVLLTVSQDAGPSAPVAHVFPVSNGYLSFFLCFALLLHPIKQTAVWLVTYLNSTLWDNPLLLISGA
ncbi:hypothetical protein BDN71DRAFT_1500141 [Pleurotus eryngii]|uniref:Uncharacterized protein n=1 Tax=Pleurotus eryngii TaxID=5323 RepID=A0A9P6CZT7_PLEER|nr:hypothetical protein BDN71DRAFT_1500141 [Pleurotus eryngii]